MQNVNYVPQTRTHYDPSQRAAQWKQRVHREQDKLAVPLESSRAGQRVSGDLMTVLPGPGSTLGRHSARSQAGGASARSGAGAGTGASGAAAVPEIANMRRALASARSSRSGRSARSSRYTGRTHTGRSTARSTARSTSSAGSQLSTFRSLTSNCSNLTEVALSRIERLEESLEEERRRREKAELEINQLRVLVHGSG